MAAIEVTIPDYKTQKTEIRVTLQQRLKAGDIWYLIDVKWMKQWKKYVGYDQWDQSHAGQDIANPGPMDNSSLFQSETTDTLRNHLMEELNYFLLPEVAWKKMTSWYGLSKNSRPIARKVVEHGKYMKHCKVEAYLLEFKCAIHPHLSFTKSHAFSRADTVGDLEAVIREMFEVDLHAECRVWHRFMTHTYELLSNNYQTLQDAGLYNGQTIVLEIRNEDGSWPRQTQTSSQHQPTGSVVCLRKVELRTTSATEVMLKPKLAGQCGLSDLGNMSFMNTIIQCLNYTIPLKELVFERRNIEPAIKKDGPVTSAMSALLTDKCSSEANCVAPEHLKSQVSRCAPEFATNTEHDCKDFLAFLLESLHKELNIVKENPRVDMTVDTKNRTDKEIAEEIWMKYLQRNQSVIVQEFQGQLKTTLVCPDCSEVSRIFDPFMFLSLRLPVKITRSIYESEVKDLCYNSEIAEKIEEHESCRGAPMLEKKNIDLQDCLKLFAQTETLRREDASYCSTCNTFVQSSKKYDLWKLPKVLIIHLHRFCDNKYGKDKLDTLVHFPISGLDLSEYVLCCDDPQPVYNLYAISHHCGEAKGGHYTASVKNHTSGKWYNFDDNRVTQMDEEYLVTASAYILFYQRVDHEGTQASMTKRTTDQDCV